MKFKLLYNEYERFSHWTASRILNSVGFIERAKGFPLEYSTVGVFSSIGFQMERARIQKEKELKAQEYLMRLEEARR